MQEPTITDKYAGERPADDGDRSPSFPVPEMKKECIGQLHARMQVACTKRMPIAASVVTEMGKGIKRWAWAGLTSLYERDHTVGIYGG